MQTVAGIGPNCNVVLKFRLRHTPGIAHRVTLDFWGPCIRLHFLPRLDQHPR
jgi:hypothetical protein